jgi:hypothetical protein
MLVVDVFKASLLTKSSIFEPTLKGPVLPRKPLMIDHQREAFFKTELGRARVFHLSGKCFCHPTEPHRPQSFLCWLN